MYIGISTFLVPIQRFINLVNNPNSFRSLAVSGNSHYTLTQVLCLSAYLVLGSTAFTNQTEEAAKKCQNILEETSKACGSKETPLIYSDEDVDMEDYNIPEDLDINEIVDTITNGKGYYIIRGLYSEKDTAMAREKVFFHNQAKKYLKQAEEAEDHHADNDERHNKFNGLVWALLNKGKIFQKMAMHPVIMNISNILIGEKSQISSLAANTVLPGQPGQLPHLDYPYYRNFYPSVNPNIMDSAPPLAVQFVTLLTEFTKNNGGTAVRPHSHHQPRYPEDEDEFRRNMVQVEGQPGDLVVFAGAIQHGAMPNYSKGFRAGILQHMVPIYVKPFENMAEYVREDIKLQAPPGLRRLLALDHPYPILKM